MTQREWKLPKVPKDSDGFVQSFSVEEEEDYLEFFEEFGFVVIKKVLSDEEINDSIREIWAKLENKQSEGVSLTKGEELYLKGSQLEKEGNPFEAMKYYMAATRLMPELDDEEVAQAVLAKFKSFVDRNDPRTWTTNNWPESSSHGFLGGHIADGPCSFRNRENPNLYRVFSKLIGTDKLWVSLDRYGLMRPTRNVPNFKLEEDELRSDVQVSEQQINQEEGRELKDHDEWKTHSTWTHWDLNPWKWVYDKEDGLPYQFSDFVSEYNGTRNDGTLKLQGLVSFVDSREEDGGFCTVPGCHKILEDWAFETRFYEYDVKFQSQYSLVPVPPEDSLHNYLEKITVRKGSLVIWRGEMAHCNFPNDSNRFRFNQYIKMFPAREGEKGTDERKTLVKKYLEKAKFEPSELGLKLLGL